MFEERNNVLLFLLALTHLASFVRVLYSRKKRKKEERGKRKRRKNDRVKGRDEYKKRYHSVRSQTRVPLNEINITKTITSHDIPFPRLHLADGCLDGKLSEQVFFFFFLLIVARYETMNANEIVLTTGEEKFVVQRADSRDRSFFR